MHAQMLHPPVCRENALNALTEIRACHEDIQAFVTGAFDRLDNLVDELRGHTTTPLNIARQAERETMQEQIDQLAKLATELAHSVAEHKQLTAKQEQA